LGVAVSCLQPRANKQQTQREERRAKGVATIIIIDRRTHLSSDHYTHYYYTFS
jgi:hypothetical protein